jgi:hypothetical protein
MPTMIEQIEQNKSQFTKYEKLEKAEEKAIASFQTFFDAILEVVNPLEKAFPGMGVDVITNIQIELAMRKKQWQDHHVGN